MRASRSVLLLALMLGATQMWSGSAPAADVPGPSLKPPPSPPSGIDPAKPPEQPPIPKFKALPPPFVKAQPLYVQQDFAYPEDRFSVEGTEAPIFSQQQEESPEGPREVRSYAFPENDALFIVRVRRSASAGSPKPEQRLEKLAPSNAKPIKHGGLTGKDFERTEGDVKMRVRIFAIDEIDYELIYYAQYKRSSAELIEDADEWLKKWHVVHGPRKSPK